MPRQTPPIKRDKQSRTLRRGFTAIEIVAVLLLSALSATLTIVSLSGLRQSSEADSVVDHVAWCNDLARIRAARLHTPTWLVFELDQGRILQHDGANANDEGAEREVYRLPAGFEMTRSVVRGANDNLGRVAIPISATGLSPSYALQIGKSGKTFWIMVAGLSGQATRVNNESEIRHNFEAQSGDGNDAH